MRAASLLIASALLMAALPLAEAQQAAESPTGTVNPNPQSSLSLENLSATRSAPLFTPSRTAPVVAEAPTEPEAVPVEAPAAPTEQPPPPLQLVGIVLTEDTKTALLLDSNNNEVHRLASGDEYEGWSLTIVDARSVEFRSGDRVEALKMFESFPAPPNVSALPEFPGNGMPPDMMAQPEGVFPPPEGVPPPAEGEPPPPEGGLRSPEGVPPPEASTGGREQVPPPSEGPPADFDPALGGVPLPEEGPLPPDAQRNPG